MGKGEGELVRRGFDWLNKHNLILVVLLSAMHIGLACIHTRDSGRTALLSKQQSFEADQASI